MRKTYAFLTAMIMAVSLSGCGSSDDESSKEQTESTAVSQSASDSKEASEDSKSDENDVEKDNTDDEASEELVITDEHREFNMVNLYYPSSFEKGGTDEGCLWYSGTLNGSDTIYYAINLNPIYEPDDTLTPEKVLEDDSKLIFDVITNVYKCYDSKYSDNYEITESVDVNGCPMVKVVGTAHTEIEEEIHEVNFVGYFGVVDFKTYGTGDKLRQPGCWIVFSDGQDDTTIQDINYIADKTAEDFDWLEY